MTDHEIVLYDMVRNNSLYKKNLGLMGPYLFCFSRGMCGPLGFLKALQTPYGPSSPSRALWASQTPC